MRLKNILSGVEFVKLLNYKNYNINNVTHVADEVERQGIFIAIKGNNFIYKSWKKKY